MITVKCETLPNNWGWHVLVYRGETLLFESRVQQHLHASGITGAISHTMAHMRTMAHGELIDGPEPEVTPMTNQVKRYDFSGNRPFPSDVGSWVLYEDIKHLLTPNEPTAPLCPNCKQPWEGTRTGDLAICSRCGTGFPLNR